MEPINRKAALICLIIAAQALAATALGDIEPGRYVARVEADGAALDLELELRPDGGFSYTESAAGHEQASFEGTYVSNGPWLSLTQAGEPGPRPGPQGLTRTFIVAAEAGSIILAPLDSTNVYTFGVLPVAPDTAVRYLLLKDGRLASPIGRYSLSYTLPNGENRDAELALKPNGSFSYHESRPGRRGRVIGIRGRWNLDNDVLELAETSGRRASLMQFKLEAESLELTLQAGPRPMLTLQPREPGQSVSYRRVNAFEPELGLLNEPHGLYGEWLLQFQNQQLSFTRCTLRLEESREFRYVEQVGEETAPRLELQGTLMLEGDVLVLVFPEKQLERRFRYRISSDGRSLLLSMLTTDGRFAFPISPVLPGWEAAYQRVIAPTGGPIIPIRNADNTDK